MSSGGEDDVPVGGGEEGHGKPVADARVGKTEGDNFFCNRRQISARWIDHFQSMTIFLSLTMVNDNFFKVLSINFCH